MAPTSKVEATPWPTSSASYPRPTHHVALPYDPALSRGPLACELGSRCGYVMQPWQRDVLTDMGARTEDGRHYVHARFGGSIPRQTGKSVVAIVWTLERAICEGARVLWSDHNYSTTCEMLRRFRRILGTRPHDPYAAYPAFNAQVTGGTAKTAQEAIFLKAPRPGAPEGGIHFATRTDSAALGYAFDMVVIDEAQELTESQMQAILPTTTSGALHDLQIIYLGTPTRPGSRGTKFRERRDEALAAEAGGPNDDLCWWEWGVPEVGDVSDETRWPTVNPSLPDVADARAIRTGMHDLSPFAFAQEYLGYWYDAVRAEALISRQEWEACATGEAPEGDATAFGVKFSPDGSTVAVAVAVALGEVTHVELVGVRATTSGTRALADSLVRTGGSAAIWIDGRSGAQALADRIGPELPEECVHVASASDAVSAAATFLDAVRERSLRWYRAPGTDGNDRLSESALTVTRRRIGSAGGWGFGGDDPTPTEAAALALKAARETPGEGEEMEVFF